MQLGLTWPLQRQLKVSVPYGEPECRNPCWDTHCITLHGRSSLLLVHCDSRYTCVRFDLSAFDWRRLKEIVLEEIRLGLQEAGIDGEHIRIYLEKCTRVDFTRTHGRREVAFLNRAWEDVLAADLLVDLSNQHQPILNHAVNQKLCRCAGEDMIDTSLSHLIRSFERQNYWSAKPTY